MNPLLHGQFIFDRGNRTYNGVNIVYSINAAENI